MRGEGRGPGAEGQGPGTGGRALVGPRPFGPRPLSFLLLHLALIAGAALALLPMLWMVSASLMQAGEAASFPPRLLPRTVTFEHYRALFTRLELGRYLLNSALIAFTVTALSLVVNSMAGYAFAKLRFRGSKGLLAFVIATMAVPTQLGIVPLFIAMSQWFHLGGSIWAVIIPALVTAFGVFWMTQFLSQSIPDELIEAARVDGASMIRTFWHVGLPASRPAAAMLALFTFVATWTNFFWPFIILDSTNPTLPVALSLLQANYFIDYSIVLAGVLLSTIPLLILFVIAGRQLVSGIMQGAVKG